MSILFWHFRGVAKPVKKASVTRKTQPARRALPRPLNVCGSKIRSIRKSKKNPEVSQEDLAKRVSVILGIDTDQSAIARIESGQRILPDFEAAAIAKALKVDVADLFKK